jgi:hypothetical protein
MIAASGVIAELAKAFETAYVEMFAIMLPEARVAAATSAVMRKWNCTREELLDRQLVKFGTGPLSARHITEETPDGPVRKIEVAYVPPLGTSRSIVFNSQNWNDGDQRYMLLIGQHASLEMRPGITITAPASLTTRPRCMIFSVSSATVRN